MDSNAFCYTCGNSGVVSTYDEHGELFSNETCTACLGVKSDLWKKEKMGPPPPGEKPKSTIQIAIETYLEKEKNKNEDPECQSQR